MTCSFLSQTLGLGGHFAEPSVVRRFCLRASGVDAMVQEDRLKSFREDGQILNYYEQTKALAGKKEDITDEQSRLNGELDAADNSLRKLEQKLAINRESFFKNNDLLTQKEAISNLTSEIAKNSLNPNYSGQDNLTEKVKQQEKTLTESVRNLYARTHSTENVQIKKIRAKYVASAEELPINASIGTPVNQA